jgi:hypothetical protein
VSTASKARRVHPVCAVLKAPQALRVYAGLRDPPASVVSLVTRVLLAREARGVMLALVARVVDEASLAPLAHKVPKATRDPPELRVTPDR